MKSYWKICGNFSSLPFFTLTLCVLTGCAYFVVRPGPEFEAIPDERSKKFVEFYHAMGLKNECGDNNFSSYEYANFVHCAFVAILNRDEESDSRMKLLEYFQCEDDVCFARASFVFAKSYYADGGEPYGDINIVFIRSRDKKNDRISLFRTFPN